MNEKAEKVSFPLKKIAALIRLAKDNNLELLQLGSIRIVPRPQARSSQSLFQDLLEENDKKPEDEKMDQKQMENLILFGVKDLS